MNWIYLDDRFFCKFLHQAAVASPTTQSSLGNCTYQMYWSLDHCMKHGICWNFIYVVFVQMEMKQTLYASYYQ